MRDKWKVRKKRYLKIHIAVNIKSKKILSMKVTDEHFRDSKVLPELLDNIIKSENSNRTCYLLQNEKVWDSCRCI